jgi:hypothetical protein
LGHPHGLLKVLSGYPCDPLGSWNRIDFDSTSERMSDSVVEKYIQVARFIRKLRGGSQPILVEGINGILYVLKFKNNLQGANVLFNEAAGIQLYKACRLPVPAWEPLLVTSSFLERNRACWIEGPTGPIRPESGLCIGIRFLRAPHGNLFEILPDSRYNRIRSRPRFWLAWIVDVCCGHTDNRQAVFGEHKDGLLHPFFTDSGNLFGGPNGEELPLPSASRYLDPLIYPDLTQSQIEGFIEVLVALCPDRLLNRTLLIPSEWQTSSALSAYQRGLDLIHSRGKLDSIVDHLLKTADNRARGQCSGNRDIWRNRPNCAFSLRGMR